MFLASAVAIVPLAKLMEQSTEALAHYLGPTYGGLLSATMGNAPELIIGIMALRHGMVEVVKGSIRRYPLMPVVSGPKGVFASVTRRRAREALTNAQQRLRRNAESCERAPAARLP